MSEYKHFRSVQKGLFGMFLYLVIIALATIVGCLIM